MGSERAAGHIPSCPVEHLPVHAPRGSGSKALQGREGDGHRCLQTALPSLRPRHPSLGAHHLGRARKVGARISSPAPDRPRAPAPLALRALDLASPRAAGAHLPPPPWVQPGERVQGTEPVAMQPSSSAGARSTAPPGSCARGASAPDRAEPNFPSQADLDPGFTSPSTPGAQGMRPAPHPHAAPPSVTGSHGAPTPSSPRN